MGLRCGLGFQLRLGWSLRLSLGGFRVRSRLGFKLRFRLSGFGLGMRLLGIECRYRYMVQFRLGRSGVGEQG